VNDRAEQLHHGERQGQPERGADARKARGLPEHHPTNGAGRRAERHADTDLVGDVFVRSASLAHCARLFGPLRIDIGLESVLLMGRMST
jgi:hypothetical protein